MIIKNRIKHTLLFFIDIRQTAVKQLAENVSRSYIPNEDLEKE